MANETMTLISTTTLASNNSTVVFSSIPQTFTDLLIYVSARSNNTSDPKGSYYTITLNGGSSYAARYLQGTGSAVSSGSLANLAGISASAGGTSNTFSNDSIYLPNYTSTTSKSYSIDSVTEQNATGAYQTLVAGSFTSSTAITSVTLFDALASGQFVTGSTFSLYGILKGSGGATVS